MAWPPRAQGTPAPVRGVLAQAVASSAQTSAHHKHIGDFSHPSGPAEPKFPAPLNPGQGVTEESPLLGACRPAPPK